MFKMTKNDKQLLEFLCETYGTDVIEEKLLSDMFKKHKAKAPIIAACLLSFAAARGIDTAVENKRIRDAEIESYNDWPGKYIPNYEEKVFAVDEYMRYAVECIGKTIHDVEIDPGVLVKMAYDNNYDLPMLMAAIHLESHFGVTDRAKRTNSPCSIGCWDNGDNRIRFMDQEEGIEYYIQIMKKNYIRGRDIGTVLQNGNLVNGIGKRYASDKNYERKLRYLRSNILKMFPVLEDAVVWQSDV